MSWDSSSERDLWADICLKDFWFFCDYALGYGSRPDFKWWTPRVHKPFCAWLQKHAEHWLARRAEEAEGWTKLMIVVMREFGKSMIATKALPMWCHLKDPNLSSYIGSSTVTRAQSFFEPVKVLLAGEDPAAAFSWLYGSWYDKYRTWTTDQIVHGARINLARSEPSIGTWGVETGLTGTHPDMGIIDDPIDYDLMAKDSRWLEKVNTHIDSLTPVFKRNALFIYVGTRYHNADFIGESLSREGPLTIEGYPMFGTPARASGKWHVYFMPARAASGEPLYPENWPDKVMKDYEAQNPLMYAAQLLQDPNTGSHVTLRRKQIDDLWVEPKDVPKRILTSIHLDTAFKSRESSARGDFSVIVVWGHAMDGTGDIFFLEGHGSNRWRVEDFNNQLIITLQRLKAQNRWPFVLTDEQEIGGKSGSWELTLQNWCHAAGLPHPTIKLLSRAGKKKIARILGSVPFWVDGRVRLVRGAPNVEELIAQMLQIGTCKYDDWADAASDVFHPEIYAPTSIKGLNDRQARIERPWDRELRVGHISDDEARWLYDTSMEQETGRAPID